MRNPRVFLLIYLMCTGKRSSTTCLLLSIPVALSTKTQQPGIYRNGICVQVLVFCFILNCLFTGFDPDDTHLYCVKFSEAIRMCQWAFKAVNRKRSRGGTPHHRHSQLHCKVTEVDHIQRFTQQFMLEILLETSSGIEMVFLSCLHCFTSWHISSKECMRGR